MGSVNKPLLTVAALCAIAAAIVALYVAGHPYIPEDATIERDLQSTNWAPLTLTFPIFSWIGDAKGAVLEAIIFVLVLVFNRRAWILAAAAALTGVWYVLLSHVINRARPTTAQGAAGHRAPFRFELSERAHDIRPDPDGGADALSRSPFSSALGPIGWGVVVLIILANAISRIYTGAHWPTDVLAGILIGVAWLSFVVSLRRISDRALAA